MFSDIDFNSVVGVDVDVDACVVDSYCDVVVCVEM